MIVDVKLVALWDAAFATRQAQATVQAAIDTLTANDYQVVQADGIWVYLERVTPDAQPS